MKIFSTLSGRKEEFLPQGDEVKMYVCGVTPYSDAHLGHAMSYIIFDVIRRYLKFRGYAVRFVQNITDIDDKIIERANQRGVAARESAEEFSQSYFDDMDALNVTPADVYPRATEEIPKMLDVIQGLIDKGYAYPAGGSVYFRVRNVPDYGKLSHRSPDAMRSAGGSEAEGEKEDPLDFVLWKASKPGEPSWESPWGPGRPGWHIECSAMSLKYLGEKLDIHGGGQDLIFPHHENEIAQSESFTGMKPFARYWLHNGMVQLGGEKMSKSLGNLVTIKELLVKYSADAVRVFVLSSHYRSPLTYSEEILDAAARGAERLRQAAYGEGSGGKGAEGLDAEPYRSRFIEAMDDDFNTAQAVAALFDLVREINRADEAGLEATEACQTLKDLGGILGLTFAAPQATPLDAGPFAEISKSTIAKLKREKLEYVLEKVAADPNAENAEGYLNFLSELRNALRKNKNFQLADMLRSELDKAGITLEDTPRGTVWKRKR